MFLRVPPDHFLYTPSFHQWNNYDQKFEDIPSSILHKYSQSPLLRPNNEAWKWNKWVTVYDTICRYSNPSIVFQALLSSRGKKQVFFVCGRNFSSSNSVCNSHTSPVQKFQHPMPTNFKAISNMKKRTWSQRSKPLWHSIILSTGRFLEKKKRPGHFCAYVLFGR